MTLFIDLYYGNSYAELKAEREEDLVNFLLFCSVKMYRDVKSRVKLIEVDGLRKVDALHYDYKVQEEQLFTRISIDLKKYKELKV